MLWSSRSGHGRAPWPALLAAGSTVGWGWPRLPPGGRTAAAWPLQACCMPGRAWSRGRRRGSHRLADVAPVSPLIQLPVVSLFASAAL
jgi:hypothetical protein